jgi:hypothetical protein
MSDDERSGGDGGDTSGAAPDGGHAQYEPGEQKTVREQYAAGEKPVCPRDGTPMTVRSIGGGSFGLGYARRREWLICPTCKRSVIFDLRRGTRN